LRRERIRFGFSRGKSLTGVHHVDHDFSDDDDEAAAAVGIMTTTTNLAAVPSKG